MTAFSGYLGVVDHDLMWSSAAVQAQVVADMVALGVKVHRCDLYASDLPDTGQVSTWCAQLRAAGIQPFPVVTFPSLPVSATIIPNLVELCRAVPGLWIEWGNELEYASPTIDPAAYVAQLAEVCSAVYAADPTALVGPSPVANINAGGSGWNWDAACYKAGLAQVPIKFKPFHGYPYPNWLAPTVPWAGGDSTETLIPKYQAQCNAWGNKAPYWATEVGYQSPGPNTSNMTDALQAEYLVQLLTDIQAYNLPVVCIYELGDGGGQTYGLMTENWTAVKPAYTAIQQAFAPVAENYQQLYQTARAHVVNRLSGWQGEAAQITAWLAANPKLAGKAEVSQILGWLNNQILIEQTWLKSQPVTLTQKEK